MEELNRLYLRNRRSENVGLVEELVHVQLYLHTVPNLTRKGLCIQLTLVGGETEPCTG